MSCVDMIQRFTSSMKMVKANYIQDGANVVVEDEVGQKYRLVITPLKKECALCGRVSDEFFKVRLSDDYDEIGFKADVCEECKDFIEEGHSVL